MRRDKTLARDVDVPPLILLVQGKGFEVGSMPHPTSHMTNKYIEGFFLEERVLCVHALPFREAF